MNIGKEDEAIEVPLPVHPDEQPAELPTEPASPERDTEPVPA